MALLMPHDGVKDALSHMVGINNAEDLVLRLFTNDITPQKGDTAATYHEPSGSGYAPKPLDQQYWIITDTVPPAAVHAQQIFSFTGPLGNVHGYFLTRANSGKIAWSERFPNGPYEITRAEDEIKVTPRIELT